jgi:malonate transporter
MVTVKHVVLNPMVLSTLIGMLCSVLGLRMPGPVTAYLGILADALTPCALFAIGLGLSIDGLRANIGRASLLSAVKLVIMPLIVYGLSVCLGLDPLYTIAAVICGAVPTAKTAYILAGEYHCEEMMVASTVSMTTLASIISLVVWLYWLSGLASLPDNGKTRPDVPACFATMRWTRFQQSVLSFCWVSVSAWRCGEMREFRDEITPDH